MRHFAWRDNQSYPVSAAFFNRAHGKKTVSPLGNSAYRYVLHAVNRINVETWTLQMGWDLWLLPRLARRDNPLRSHANNGFAHCSNNSNRRCGMWHILICDQ